MNGPNPAFDLLMGMAAAVLIFASGLASLLVEFPIPMARLFLGLFLGSTVLAFLLGCIVGLAGFSRFLSWGLSHHYDTVLALTIGLMAGAFRVPRPWPGVVESVRLKSPGDVALTTGAVFAGGVAVVLVIHPVARQLQHRSIRDEVEGLQAI